MKVAILGWGVDTQDAVPYLQSQGAVITVFDRKSGLDKKNFPYLRWKLGKEDFGDLSDFDLIIRSPGVYRYRPEIVAAEKAGVKISSKTKLFFDLCPAKTIGVTGTKGKGTTATLIYEILKAAGKKVFLGGNIGSGMFGILGELGKNSWMILELSSFQLIDLHKSPHIAVVLMVTSEHLDWHPDVQEYIEAKKNITSHQSESDFVVINDDFSNSKLIGEASPGRKIFFSRTHKVARGCYLMQKNMMYRCINNKEIIIHQDAVKLRGAHNLENVMAAICVAKIAGVEDETIQNVVKAFKGLEHRLEEVATVNGVKYFNDSFSTTPETTIAAIKSFSEPLILIAGGSEKGSDFTELGKTIAEAKNIKTVILIGLMADRIEKAISLERRRLPRLKIIRGLKNMAEIVQMAYNKAISGDLVLLSPACASFDMFKNYKDRGNQFKQEIRKLKVKS